MAKKRKKKEDDAPRSFIGKLFEQAKDSAALSNDERLIAEQVAVIEQLAGRVKLVVEDIEWLLDQTDRIIKANIYTKLFEELPPLSRKIRIYADVVRAGIPPQLRDNPNIFLSEGEDFNRYLNNPQEYEENRNKGVTDGSVSKKNPKYSELLDFDMNAVLTMTGEELRENFKDPAIILYTVARTAIGMTWGFPFRNYLTPDVIVESITRVIQGPIDYRLPSNEIGLLNIIAKHLTDHYGLSYTQEYVPNKRILKLRFLRVMMSHENPTDLYHACLAELRAYVRQTKNCMEGVLILTNRLSTDTAALGNKPEDKSEPPRS